MSILEEDCKRGKAKAAVLPVPVWAQAQKVFSAKDDRDCLLLMGVGWYTPHYQKP